MVRKLLAHENTVLEAEDDRMTCKLTAIFMCAPNSCLAQQVMAVARTLVAHEDAVLEAEASNPTQQKARELGVDPLWAPDRKAQTAAAFASAPRFLLLDFRCAVVRCAITPAPPLHLPRQHNSCASPLH